MTLWLTSISFDRVNFLADFGEWQRPVRVDVGSGTSWLTPVRFPTWSASDGESLGDDELDQQVRERAAEELARLQGAVYAASRYSEFAA